MIYGFIAALVLGVLAYIQYLRSELGKHQTEILILKSQKSQAEWQDKIDQSKTKITESEKDYAQARDDFRNKYGTGNPSSS